MLIDLRGLKMVSESTHHTCPFHEKNPGVSHAGCTCSASFSGRYIVDPNPPRPCTHCKGTGMVKDPE